jgi:hypothetical protein
VGREAIFFEFCTLVNFLPSITGRGDRWYGRKEDDIAVQGACGKPGRSNEPFLYLSSLDLARIKTETVESSLGELPILATGGFAFSLLTAFCLGSLALRGNLRGALGGSSCDFG